MNKLLHTPLHHVIVYLLFCILISCGSDPTAYDHSEDTSYPHTFESVCFVDANTGWVVGGNAILRTDDGGTTWISQNHTASDLHSVCFSDATNGCVASSGMILTTNDGGNTWTEQQHDMTKVNSIHFVDAQYGWAAGRAEFQGDDGYSAVVYSTSDGGIHWHKKYKRFVVNHWIWGGAIFLRVFAIDRSTAWVAGNYNAVGPYRTTDAGDHWRPPTSLPTWTAFNRSISDLFFIDADIGWLSIGNEILKSTDGGKTWTSYETISDDSLSPDIPTIHFIDQNTGWAIRDRQIIKSIDGGETWALLHIVSEMYSTLNDLQFIDASIGWVVGANETILKTTDGGETWEVQMQDFGSED